MTFRLRNRTLVLMNGAANKNQVFRSVVSVRGSEVVVSTIKFRDGRATVFETALAIGGVVSEVARCDARGSASVLHDRVCDIVRGYETDLSSRLVERVVRAAADCFETLAARQEAA